mgnify:CR=1 FL=1
MTFLAVLGLAAVDHCTFLTDEDVSALRDSGTIATLLPGVEFSTRSPYPDARALWDAGVRVALASDCNPGSCYTSSMPLCVALAVREMRMSPAEALAAATLGGARSLGLDDRGFVAPGAVGDDVATTLGASPASDGSAAVRLQPKPMASVQASTQAQPIGDVPSQVARPPSTVAEGTSLFDE